MPGNSCVIISICELCSFETQNDLSNIKRKKRDNLDFSSNICWQPHQNNFFPSGPRRDPGPHLYPPWQSTNRPNNENQAQAVQSAHKTNLQTLNRDIVLAAG